MALLRPRQDFNVTRGSPDLDGRRVVLRHLFLHAAYILVNDQRVSFG